MSIFGSAPKPQMPPPLPPTPERTDTETASLADAQRRRFAASGDGRAATFLTGGGLTQGSSAVRYLGGAAQT